jgi:hypothetical protein
MVFAIPRTQNFCRGFSSSRFPFVLYFGLCLTDVSVIRKTIKFPMHKHKGTSLYFLATGVIAQNEAAEVRKNDPKRSLIGQNPL